MIDLKHRLEFLDPATLAPSPANWRSHGAEQRAAFEGVLAELGWLTPLLFNATTGRLLDGHMRREQAIANRLPAIPVIVVELDPAQEAKALASLDTLGLMAGIDPTAWVELLKDVDTGCAELMGLFGELSNEWVPDFKDPKPARKPRDTTDAGDDQAEDDFDLAPDDDEPADGDPTPSAGSAPAPEPAPEAAEPDDPGVPDVVFPGDNPWDIPTLDLRMGADAPDFPVTIWGSVGRKRPMPGTWSFYTADRRFGSIWKNPRHVLESGAVAIIEPNYSTHPQMPRARVLWDIFKKRWLARYWQSQGLRVFVDLNVGEEVRDLNFLGVPTGWRAYATRSHCGGHAIEAEWQAAALHSGRDDLVFLVYGGGIETKALCAARGWFWVPEDSDSKRGKAP